MFGEPTLMEAPRAPAPNQGIKKGVGIPSVGSFFCRAEQTEVLLRKREVLTLSKQAQLEIIAGYALCKHSDAPVLSNPSPESASSSRTAWQNADSCSCVGWRPFQSDISKLPAEIDGLDVCRVCGHSKRDHYEHLTNLGEDDRVRLVKKCFDAETLHATMQKEQDAETKKILLYLYRTLRKAIIELNDPQLDGLDVLGKPPFESPTLNVSIKTFLRMRMTMMDPPEWQHLIDAARGCLMAMNHWRVDPSRIQPLVDNADYVRWLCFCHVPTYCDSFPHSNIAQVFGRKFFQTVMPFYKTQLMAYVKLRKETVGPDRQRVIDNYFPMFLDLFQQELNNKDALIWDVSTAAILEAQAQQAAHQAHAQVQAQVQAQAASTQAAVEQLSTEEQEHARKQQLLQQQQQELLIQQQKLQEQRRLLEIEQRRLLLKQQQVRDAALERSPILPTSYASAPPVSILSHRFPDSSSLPTVPDNDEDKDRDANFLKPWIPTFTEQEVELMLEKSWNLVESEAEPRPIFDDSGKIPCDAGPYIENEMGKIEVRLLVPNPGESILSEIDRSLFLQVLQMYENLFPCMPREYIARCVIDPRHRTIVVVRKSKCVAALCCRLLPNRQFAEITLMGVQGREQMKGIGSFLLYTFLDCMQDIEMKYIVACVDEESAKFFKSFGFALDLSTVFPSPDVYDGYALEYEGGVLYGMALDPEVIYTELFSVLKHEGVLLKMIWERRNFLLDEVEVDGSELFQSPGTVLRTAEIPGLKKFGYNAELERSLVDRDVEVLPGACPPDSDDESGRNSATGHHSTTGSMTNGKPGSRSKEGKQAKTQRGRKLPRGDIMMAFGRDLGHGPRPIIQRYTWSEDIDQDTLQNIFKTVLNQVKSHHSAWPFLKPVDRSDVPDYYDVIRFPMDLRTMTERLKRGYYTHKNMFMIDMRRMLRNCRIYNGPETEYFKCADLLQKFYVSKMQEFGIDAVV